MNPLHQGKKGCLSRRVAFILCVLAAVCLAHGEAWGTLKAYMLKQGRKQIAKTAAKKYIPVANVAATAYETTQFLMEGIDLFDAATEVIEGVVKEQPWAISYNQVYLMGWQVDADNDTSHAISDVSTGSVLGDAANSHAEAVKNTGRMTIYGASQGWASWLGMAGIGAKGTLGGQAIKTIVVQELDQMLDPYNTPIIDPSKQVELEREVQLLYPSGFDYLVRVYYPTSTLDSVGPLYYEAEVFGYLAVYDSTAYELSDAMRPAVYSIAEYYNRAGTVTKHIEGASVCNLASDSFVFFEADTARSISGELVPTYGYKLEDFDLEFYVNAPAWPGGEDQYVRYDFQAIEGGASEGGYVGPQWNVRDANLFQDNFPEDESDIESYVRADMAQDINPSGSSIHPGDSVVVNCFDLFSDGLADYLGGPAIFLHVRVTDIGPYPSRPNLCGPSLAGNYGHYVSNDGTWTIIQGDSARVSGVPEEGKYMFDLNDSLLSRGYRIDYYFSATNTDGETSTVPQRTSIGEHFEFTCLPTFSSDILYVDGYHGYGTLSGNVEQYFMPTFDAVLAPPNNQPDRYDINDPAAFLSNSLGSRATAQQLFGTYRTIVWDSGDISKGTIRDGTPATDKSPDCQVLNEWMEFSPYDVGLWVCGDNVATELSNAMSPPALMLLSYWCGVDLFDDSYFDLTGGLTTPTIKGAAGGIFIHAGVPDQFAIDGRGVSPKRFDVLEKTGSGQYALDYPTFSGTPYHAGIQAVNTNAMERSVRTMWFGFSVASIRGTTGSWPAPIVRNELANNVFAWMEQLVNVDITGSDPPAAYRLGQNYPNPFNPSTTAVFEMRQKGHVTIKIYNVAGQLVRTLVNEVKDKGSHRIIWDGANDAGNTAASGIYFYEMTAGGSVWSKKMVLLR